MSPSRVTGAKPRSAPTMKCRDEGDDTSSHSAVHALRLHKDSSSAILLFVLYWGDRLSITANSDQASINVLLELALRRRALPDHHPGYPDISSDLPTSNRPSQLLKTLLPLPETIPSQPRQKSGSQNVQGHPLCTSIADLVLSIISSSPAATLRCPILVCEHPRARRPSLLSALSASRSLSQHEDPMHHRPDIPGSRCRPSVLS